jgi:hypothetical protein
MLTKSSQHAAQECFNGCLLVSWLHEESRRGAGESGVNRAPRPLCACQPFVEISRRVDRLLLSVRLVS